MLTARELRLAGMSVLIVEKGFAGRESTWAGGGILSPLYPWRYPQAVTALARWGQQRYPAFARELLEQTGLDPEYRRSGLLILDDENEFEVARRWAQQQDEPMETVDASQIRAVEPAVGAAPLNAIWMPQVGQLRNPRLAQALRLAMEKLGVELLEQTEVLDLKLKNGQVAGISTTRGEFRGEQVVVAGGAWSGEWMKQTGLSLPVRPVKGQMILYQARPETLQRIVLSQDRYVIPRRDGRVLVGSTLEDSGFDKSTSKLALAELQAEAVRIVPALARFPVEHQWAGLRPGSPTGIPYIGEHPDIQGLYVNSGHFRNGVVLGLASARLMADIMLRRMPFLPVSDYRLNR